MPSPVSFDADQHPVNTEFVHREVTAVGTAGTASLVAADRAVASHRRRWGRERATHDPLRYPVPPRRKLAAVDFARQMGG